MDKYHGFIICYIYKIMVTIYDYEKLANIATMEWDIDLEAGPFSPKSDVFLGLCCPQEY